MREKLRHIRWGRWLLFVMFFWAVLFAIVRNQASMTEKLIHFCCDEGKNNVYVMKSGIGWKLVSAGQEKTDSVTRFILKLESETEESAYRWLKLSEQQKRNDFAELEEILYCFAANQNIEGHYSVYVKLQITGTDIYVFYDGLSGWLWLPARLDGYLKMYEQFQTFSCSLVLEQEGGEEFLREWQLIQIEDGVVREKTEAEYRIMIRE